MAKVSLKKKFAYEELDVIVLDSIKEKKALFENLLSDQEAMAACDAGMACYLNGAIVAPYLQCVCWVEEGRDLVMAAAMGGRRVKRIAEFQIGSLENLSIKCYCEEDSEHCMSVEMSWEKDGYTNNLNINTAGFDLIEVVNG